MDSSVKQRRSFIDQSSYIIYKDQSSYIIYKDQSSYFTDQSFINQSFVGVLFGIQSQYWLERRVLYAVEQ